MGVSIFFSALRASVWSKNKGRGGGGGGGSFPGSTTVIHSTSPQLRAIFHAIEKDKSKPLACTRDMMNNEVKARIHNNQ